MSYIRFESEEERLLHPIARLIPANLWNDSKYGFSKRLDRRLLPLFHCQTEEELLVRLKDIHNDSLEGAKIYLYCLFRFPKMDIALLENLQMNLSLSNENTLIILGAFKRFDYGKKILDRSKSFRRRNIRIKNAFKIACENAYLALAQWLYGELSSQQIKRELLKANDYGYLRDAMVNGEMLIAQWLYNVSHKVTQRKMLEVCYKKTFKEVCEKGHYSTAYWFYYLAGSHRQEEMLRDAEDALETAEKNSHTDVVQWIFSLSVDVFKRAESKVGNPFQCSGVQVNLFVNNWLRDLKDKQDRYGSVVSGITFNILPREAIYAYYVLRYLIRQNNENMLTDIEFLLNIPSVKAIIQKACQENSNELLDLAEDKNNLPAKALLLEIPEVKELAEKKAEELYLEKILKKRKRVEEAASIPMLQFNNNEFIPWQLEIFKSESKRPVYKKVCAYEIQESGPQSGLCRNSEDWWPTSRLV